MMTGRGVYAMSLRSAIVLLHGFYVTADDNIATATAACRVP